MARAASSSSSHQAAVTFDIGCEDSDQPAIERRPLPSSFLLRRAGAASASPADRRRERLPVAAPLHLPWKRIGLTLRAAPVGCAKTSQIQIGTVPLGLLQPRFEIGGRRAAAKCAAWPWSIVAPIKQLLRANIKFFGRRGRFIRERGAAGPAAGSRNAPCARPCWRWWSSSAIDARCAACAAAGLLWRCSVVIGEFERLTSLNDWRSSSARFATPGSRFTGASKVTTRSGIGWQIRDAELCRHPPPRSCPQARLEVGRRFPDEALS